MSFLGSHPIGQTTVEKSGFRKKTTENIKSSHIMLAHSPEACKNATSSNKKELPEKQWNRKENTFLALTCDVPVFHMPCAALGTISSGMWWNWKSCREGDSPSGGTEQFLYKQRLSAPKLFALGGKRSLTVHIIL